MSQLLTGHARSVRLFVAALLLAAAVLLARLADIQYRISVAAGGELRVSIRTEPRNFARFGRTRGDDGSCRAADARAASSASTASPTRSSRGSRKAGRARPTACTTRSSCVRTSRSPTASRSRPTTSCFRSRRRTPRASADTLEVDGKRLTVAAVDPLTVTLTFPGPFAPGLRILDNLLILPRHKLERGAEERHAEERVGPVDAAVRRSSASGRSCCSDYQPGQRLVLRAQPALLAPRQQGRAAAVSGSPDARGRSRSEHRAAAARVGSDRRDRQRDAGRGVRVAQARRRRRQAAPLRSRPGALSGLLWFNLKPGAFAGDPRASWLQRDELRRAISLAVDRKLFVDTVFLGAGVPIFGPVSPANKRWYWTGTPPAPHDPGAREDAAGVDWRARPSIRRGSRSSRRRGVRRSSAASSVIRDELKKIGVDGRRRGARRQRARASRFLGAQVRRGVLQLLAERHRSGDELRLLAELGQRAHLESRAEDAGDATGSASIDDLMRAAGRARRSRRAEAAVRRGADDLRRAPAGRLLRRAARVRRQLDARRQRHAGGGAAAAAVVARHDDGDRRVIAFVARRLAVRRRAGLCRLVGVADARAARAGDYVTETLGVNAQPRGRRSRRERATA